MKIKRGINTKHNIARNALGVSCNDLIALVDIDMEDDQWQE
tara:strand:- start:6966 stop:7088 length:123 start_codon:yes stop_codon:yes gene_type:complete